MSKCKHNSLSIATKVEALEKLDQGESVKKIVFGLQHWPINNLFLKTANEKIFIEKMTLKKKCLKKTLCKAKIENIDKVMMDWIYQRRIEGMSLNRGFSHSSRKAWSTFNNLTGRSRHSTRNCPVSANAIAAQLVRNQKYEGVDRESSRLISQEVSDR